MAMYIHRKLTCFIDIMYLHLVLEAMNTKLKNNNKLVLFTFHSSLDFDLGKS